MNLIRKEYNREYFENPFYRESIKSSRNQNRLSIIRAFKKAGRLLEIGFGKGEFLHSANQYFNVEGVDVSEYALATAEHPLRNKVRHFDIEGDQPLDDQYDVIVAFNVLEHLSAPPKAVSRIYQALQHDGLFIGSVPCNSGLIGRVHTAITNLFDRTHLSTYSPKRWRELLSRNGFRRIQFFGEIMLGKDNSTYVRGRLWNHLSFNLMFTCSK